MRRAVLALCMMILLMLPLSGQQQQPYSLSVNVDLVVLNVRVLDKYGQPVKGLSREAFRVEEDGRPQDIRLFTGEDAPATVGFVLDSSASINSKHSQIRNAALRFVLSMHPGDEVFVLQFNERLYWMLPEELPFTNNINWLEQALDWTPASGRTALYDAVNAAIEHANSGKLEKRALIMLSDGGDNASRKTLGDVLRLAQESNATIYTIGLFDPLTDDSNRSVLRKLAESTGGDAYMPETNEELLSAWETVLQGIRSQYTIGYRPQQTALDGNFHRVRLRVTAPGLTKLSVHTRPGYRARKELAAKP